MISLNATIRETTGKQNRSIIDFRKHPSFSTDINIYTGGTWEVSFEVDLFHYLTNFLETNEKTKELEQQYNEFLNNNEDLGYYASMEQFLVDELGLKCNSFNSYNDESNLSQVIQGCWFSLSGEREEYPDYLMLQIHGGFDVRGGYTKPRIFYVPEYDYFVLAEFDINASCSCTSMYSDDYGYHWYLDNTKQGKLSESKRKEYKFIASWKPKLIKKGKDIYENEYKLHCKYCNKLVSFGCGF